MTIIRTDSVRATVLVIESDPLMLTAMGSVLDSNGYRVALARTEAVAMQSIATGSFDVIILSIDQLDQGCEFATRLHQQPAVQDTPIVFLVPELAADWKERLSARGGVFSMLKPVDPNGLVDLVEKALWMPHLANRSSIAGSHLSSTTDWVRLD